MTTQLTKHFNGFTLDEFRDVLVDLMIDNANDDEHQNVKDLSKIIRLVQDYQNNNFEWSEEHIQKVQNELQTEAEPMYISLVFGLTEREKVELLKDGLNENDTLFSEACEQLNATGQAHGFDGFRYVPVFDIVKAGDSKQ